uniref:Ankyrin repeat protein n=1 Tax=Marseillevirus LCMAC101 TaxID=2506602 RepID=A0A481YS63_9VIRU|nr:MAG: ankyrin repeat protein [Marseillevirus LCMAC101]
MSKVEQSDPVDKELQFMNPIFAAAKIGNIQELTDILKAKKVNPNIRNSFAFGWTPLMYAADNNQPEACKILLEYHADPHSICGGLSNTALGFAARAGNLECVEILHSYGASINGNCTSPLVYALKNNKISMVELLLKLGADPNKNTVDSPVLVAAKLNSVEALELLRVYGANLYYRGINGNSALDIAFREGSSEAFAYLGDTKM